MINKVMLVDDMEISNAILKKMLAISAADIQVFEFTNACIAFENIQTVMPDLIFLDINMPLLDGWEFLDKMIEHQLNHQVIILTSSVSFLEKRRAADYSNVVDYCNKPIRKEQLINYVRPVEPDKILVPVSLNKIPAQYPNLSHN